MIHRESMDAYLARKALHAKMAWRMITDCPAQAWWESPLNELRIEKQSLEFDIGTATHLLNLEPGEFAARTALIPYDTYQTKDARELRDQAYIDGRVPLRPKDYRLVTAMHQALRESLGDLMFGEGDNEVSYTWETDGVPCKARADRIIPGAIINLKTANNAGPDAFQRAMVRDGHHLTAAWYLDGWKEEMQHLFVVVSKAAPHLVGVYRLDDRTLEWGRMLCRKAIDLFRQCHDTGIWPGYSALAAGGERVINIGLPSWAEYRLADMEWRQADL